MKVQLPGIEVEVQHWMRVVLTEQELEQAGGHGVSVATVDVERADGKKARYFLRLYRSERSGRIGALLSTPKGYAKDCRHKALSAGWLDYAERFQEAVGRYLDKLKDLGEEVKVRKER